MKQVQVRYKRHRSVAADARQPEKTSTPLEHQLDDALEETFPASDPISLTMPRARRKSDKARH